MPATRRSLVVSFNFFLFKNKEEISILRSLLTGSCISSCGELGFWELANLFFGSEQCSLNTIAEIVLLLVFLARALVPVRLGAFRLLDCVFSKTHSKDIPSVAQCTSPAISFINECSFNITLYVIQAIYWIVFRHYPQEQAREAGIQRIQWIKKKTLPHFTVQTS